MAIYNHTGHVVTDLERSKRFYIQVLGFADWYELKPDDAATSKLCGLAPPLGVTAHYLTLGSFVLELMHYAAPGAAAPYRERSMAEPGLTHLSISVPDIRAAATKAVEYGGAIIEESDLGLALMIRDPDGQLIELLTEDFSHSRPLRPQT